MNTSTGKRGGNNIQDCIIVGGQVLEQFKIFSIKKLTELLLRAQFQVISVLECLKFCKNTCRQA